MLYIALHRALWEGKHTLSAFKLLLLLLLLFLLLLLLFCCCIVLGGRESTHSPVNTLSAFKRDAGSLTGGLVGLLNTHCAMIQNKLDRFSLQNNGNLVVDV